MIGAAYGGLAALQLAGGYFASQNIKATADLNKDIADMNAEFAELDAYDARAQGETNQALYQKQVDDTLAEQRTMMNAQNIDTSYGSAGSIASETNFTAQLNLMQIEKDAQFTALGYKRQARDTRLGGTMQYASDRARAGQAMFSGITSAMSTGLTGYARAGGTKYTGSTGPKYDSAGGTTSMSKDYLEDPNI